MLNGAVLRTLGILTGTTLSLLSFSRGGKKFLCCYFLTYICFHCCFVNRSSCSSPAELTVEQLAELIPYRTGSVSIQFSVEILLLSSCQRTLEISNCDQIGHGFCCIHRS
jgi:hypothetical protein